jgi:hypothetical protein
VAENPNRNIVPICGAREAFGFYTTSACALRLRTPGDHLPLQTKTTWPAPSAGKEWSGQHVADVAGTFWCAILCDPSWTADSVVRSDIPAA